MLKLQRSVIFIDNYTFRFKAPAERHTHRDNKHATPMGFIKIRY